MNKELGVYIHVPFCVQKCRYCDFCSFEKSEQSTRKSYVDALCNELIQVSEQARAHTVDTVFFGGGTPSLLSTADIHKISQTLHKYYSVTPDAEITLEMNPATANREKLRAMREMGINRLSIGMQSSVEGELSLLGRIHTYSDFLRSYEDARACGFDNINVDVMYGIPDQSVQSCKSTVSSLIGLGVEHISAYSLKIEEGTPFYRERDTLNLPDEDEEYEMYMSIAEMLSGAGYSHYEISNYAKDSRHCRHNLKYWRGQEYLGFGVAAYSYFNSKRYGNARELDEYISSRGSVSPVDLDELDDSEREREYIMLRLRLREGISDEDFYGEFGVGFSEKYASVLNKFLNSEYMESSDGRYFLTDKGMYVSNSILVELL